jgi:hypothetical protein
LPSNWIGALQSILCVLGPLPHSLSLSVVPFVKSDGSDIVLEALLQRAFIKSKAIDVEALCIYTGKRVWRLKVRVLAARCLPSGCCCTQY